MTFRLRTADVESHQRLDYWQACCAEHIGAFDLKTCDRNTFDAGFDLAQVGDLKLGRFTGVSQTLKRTGAAMRSSDPDDFVVLLESDNRFMMDHCGRQHVGRGSIVFLDIARPYDTTHPDRLDVVDVFIPRKALESVLGAARHAAGLSIEPTQASFPIISGFLRSLHASGGSLDAMSAARMASIAVELVAAGLAERMEQAPPRTMSGAALLCRAQSYIADRLGMAGLGMQEVAAALNISVRRLHQIAADEQISLSDWMWERRLQRAHAMLADAVHHALPVGRIAFQCGFTDPAHFSRRFKEKFGLSPSDVRRALASTPGLPDRPAS